MPTTKPASITLRAYDVGFGDCFLLSFHYAAGSDRHVLIDFGSMSLPEGKTVVGSGPYMERIAREIERDCGGALTAVVATHRHRDHISGFQRDSSRQGPGAIIRALKPQLVVQPWTEDPRAERDALRPTKTVAAYPAAKRRRALHLRSLHDMNRYAEYARTAAPALKGKRFAELRRQIEVLGDDNGLRNRDAVMNLMDMGARKPRYVYYGARSGLDALLPGVRTRVLGPPTLEQTDSIRVQRDKDPDEFWHIQAAFWARHAALHTAHRGGRVAPLFPRHVQRRKPWDARWYAFHAQREHAESMLSIVRTLDQAMNNTSVILLFQVGDAALLFPGDAQYENWMYALAQPGVATLLKNVTLYKVGHHGSLNATPKSLWRGFRNKGATGNARRLQSILSTKDDVHGGEDGRPTEVPRGPLVEALAAESTLVDTRQTAKNRLSQVTTITLPG